MNFGQNILTWAQTNLQPLVLVGLIAFGGYFLLERKFSKIAGLIAVGVIAVGFVFFTTDVKDLLGNMFTSFFK